MSAGNISNCYREYKNVQTVPVARFNVTKGLGSYWTIGSYQGTTIHVGYCTVRKCVIQILLTCCSRVQHVLSILLHSYEKLRVKQKIKCAIGEEKTKLCN